MKIMILGGDGFIGSHLRDELSKNENNKIIVIDKNTLRFKNKSTNINTYLFDLMHDFDWHKFKDVFIKENPDFVFNCIAVANPDFYVKEPILTYEIDFKLNKKIIDFLVNQRTPFIHFSTSEVYGKIQTTDMYNEITSNFILGPSHKIRWIYATSKILLEQLIFSYIKKFKIEACIVRPFNFIGYDIDWIPSLDMCNNEWKPRVYSCFMDNLLKNESLKIVHPGSQKRCYCYIDDAIDCFMSILNNWDKCKGKVLNIGNPNNEITILDLAKLMIKKDNEITLNKFNKDTVMVSGNDFYGIEYEDSMRRMPDINLIENLTEWKPKILMEEMIEKSIKKTLEWIKKY